jgi:hypothetical protein
MIKNALIGQKAERDAFYNVGNVMEKQEKC